MSVRSQVQAAEEALRQALINALAEGDEDCLSELFTQYQAISNLNKKVNDLTHFAYDSNYNFNLSSDYLPRPGGDLDNFDNVIDFGGNISINTNSDDTITFN
ncbi:hypothetical protein M1M14_gp173 [Synechococcus phage ACG-2014e]|jgi:hypothetical protein|uniref:Uncharacterized protein n=1 Tax=Synechococcus phage ACG-2014e TaxID=1493510 RepID=A0A0E3FLJ9_9CAUD|nr:hypothetical protein AAJ58_gp170 [Synechococcus phage ACG-2014e]YP_010355785.1 hypothetical protein M1M14_gp173 [Synechococcus phage ACG-2014e]AIX20636.1 hypothetical protein Syn7803C85_173 [Synechococcus phage ACG-2014e]AIX29851.1 hypothetical protein Syn7803US33_170 [Synechococcus phage ACG-2014e]AIX45089.1 hypothetical protein Syn7803C2_170 [Synechococcus phage ACG-2014e]